MKNRKRVIPFIAVLTACVALLAACGSSSTGAAEKNMELRAELDEACQPGNYITFGSYEQDSSTENGAEAIEWLVLAREDDKVLVISRYALECRVYNENVSATWETSTLRAWLNDSFIKNAFTSEELSLIQITEVQSSGLTYGGNDLGNYTQDRIFLLSTEEAEEYFSDDAARQCERTSYAKAQDAEMGASLTITGSSGAKNAPELTAGACSWWLRSVGVTNGFVADVDNNGTIQSEGNLVNTESISDYVRPAMWIDLS